jgi:hypothetical protein
MLFAARSSQDLASCWRATARAPSKMHLRFSSVALRRLQRDFRVFRKPSAISPTREPNFHGFPQYRLRVLKPLGFGTGGDLLSNGSEGDSMTKSEGRKVAKRVAIYLRVSTTEQTTANQRRELHAVAKRHGWSVVQVFEDAGISGSQGPQRPSGAGRIAKVGSAP